uniref:Presequence protease, mitochondrial n=1 Tax=Aceria tosichella TaxID=561515 RepID=A0A6G1SA68_9ACAR
MSQLLLLKSACPTWTSRSLVSRLLSTNRVFNSQAAAAAAETNDLKVGDKVHGYKVERIDFIKELNIKPYYLRHQSTGAEHLHVHKEGDGNNVFAVSLRTTPTSSSGVAHILEHLALCGSKQFAVRDPFFKMTTRSLATFMNAMTGPDFTVYPFSTQNKRDFENLLKVYTDAVFFPRLRPVDFRQEGWRLEHEVPDNKETPIVIRGVVYNEMKGVFSSSSSIYGRQLLNNLFPDTTYRYESGGDPEDIPKLSHDELKRFHQLHYHPSNAKFFTYGDFPLEDHLRLIDELVLSKFSENSQAREKSLVTEQAFWDKARTVDISCPPDPMSATPDKQATTSISYLLPTQINDHNEMFSLQLLSSLLIDGPNAPFYKSLIESGIGADYSPSTGLATYTKQPYFSVGLQNIHPNDTTKVHQIIEDTFRKAAETGFSSDRVDAALHDIELSLKHIRGNFGLRLVMSMESVWNHDGDVIDYFKVNKCVKKFKEDLASDKDYWKKLIEKYFLKNNHNLILNMSPDASYEEKRKEREKSLLEDKTSQLDDVELQTILYEGMELLKIQNSKDDPSILPCLDPSKDISRDLLYRTELEFDEHNGASIQLCEQPTNEVVYFRAITDIGDKLEEHGLIDYLPLFCDVATKLGAGSYTRQQFAQKIQLTTGGMGVSMMINPSLSKFDVFKKEICFGSHCLHRNTGHMFELWSNVFKQIHFHENKEYLFQLIKAAAAELSEGISHSGHAYAIKRSASSLSVVSSIDERLSGLTHVARMKDMASKENIDDIVEKLRNIARIALDPSNMKCAINAEPQKIKQINDELKKFIDTAKEVQKADEGFNIKPVEYECTKVEDMKFPFATHFVAKSLVTVPRLHKHHAKLAIMSKLISSKYLLREIREKGGAYGAGARLSNSGLLHFYSYRDPNTDKTIKAFDDSCNWLVEGEEYNERDIEESKLGVFQDIDKPVEPGRRGLNYFTTGETDDMRQDYRKRLLDVNKDDVVKVAKKFLNQKNAGTHII